MKHESRSILSSTAPIDFSYDVIVCGGGPAGWIAAIAASRQGARTALIERLGFLGGTATSCLVVPISGFYFGEKLVVGGIPYEFINNLEQYNAAVFEMPKGHVSVDTEYYKLIAQRMVLSSGVDLFTNSYIYSAESCNGVISSVDTVTKGGIRRFKADYYIDATGDADLGALIHVPMCESESPQPISLCFELSDVDCNTPLLKNCIHHNGINGSHSCNSVIHDFLNEEYRSGGPQFGGPWFNTALRGNTLVVNVTRNGARVLSPDDYTRAECQLREDMFRITGMLRERYPEFSKCHISASGINAGVRESRQIIGNYVLTRSDLLSGNIFDDTIAYCSHPMDVHKAGSTAQSLTPLPQIGSIPYRCLYADGYTNLLFAGRCISSDSDAFASIRVQATAMAVGQAAGTAAAICLKTGKNVSELDFALLRNQLKENGAIL